MSHEFLELAHSELPDRWEELFIPSMEKTYQYYFKAVSDPTSVESPSTDEGVRQLNVLTQARSLDEFWSDWYEANRNSIRAGIRRMAE